MRFSPDAKGTKASELRRSAMRDFDSFFEHLAGSQPYRFQRRLAAATLGARLAKSAGLGDAVREIWRTADDRPHNGVNVLATAPTGAGKTWAALAPFIYSHACHGDLADRVIYALPMRSLASSLYESTRQQLGKAGLLGRLPVRLQTGETTALRGVGDHKFTEGRIIFCTIDQLLSSYLTIPFSLSRSQANINAGALVGSLIVADEVHLLDPERSLRTLLLMVRHLNGLARFIWMTATLAAPARQRLLQPDRLGGVEVEVTADELRRMPSQQGKRRQWQWHEEAVGAGRVWDQHISLPREKRRTLAVCNTVGRAQRLFHDLWTRARNASAKLPWLLHSRFTVGDRGQIERAALAAFAKESTEEGLLVATQVVEAGLDISATHLHTELAPANALVQRAGRCARYAGEDGKVSVYDCLDEIGRRVYAPYSGDGTEPDAPSLRLAMDAAATYLASWCKEEARISEGEFVDCVHSALDISHIDAFREEEWRRKAADAMTHRADAKNYNQAHRLIRDADSVPILLASDATLADPGRRLRPEFRPATISVTRRSLAALSRRVAENPPPEGWCLKAPTYEADEFHRLRFADYRTVAKPGDDFMEWLVATYQPGPLVLNCRLARYVGPGGEDAPVGLRLCVASAEGDWLSEGTPPEEDLKRQRSPDWSYSAELYEDHISRVRNSASALCSGLISNGRPGHRVGLSRVDSQYGLPAGTAVRTVELAVALHDLGKLTWLWQEAIWRWQEAKARDRRNYPSGQAGDERHRRANKLIRRRQKGEAVLLAHSDYDHNHVWPSGTPEHRMQRHYRRPLHALEGAWLSLPLAGEILGDSNLLKVVSETIGKHHSPAAGLADTGCPEVRLAAGSRVLVEKLLQAEWREQLPPSEDYWENFLESCVRRELKPAGDEEDWRWWPFAMLCVRLVRLADQEATGEASNL